ncbi:hypothetical protein EZV62_011090 [Acer yangbiense]|uniref:GH10 domain-containing protein n=1 Tax=Acer yangbiense TaxID=1000413 RepID=A0A5C7I6G0_9ROSI|nr:hypothetical protein EZV62_011090 [Acer yangbiense]
MSTMFNEAQCLAEPGRAHYGGGRIVNPEFNRGVEGWTVFGQGAIKQGTSKESGNRFIVAHSRRKPLDSFSQKILLENGKFYSFSAWVQISEGSETVAAIFKTSDGKLLYGGKVLAKHGCWSLLKGGLVANFTSSAHIIFKSNNTGVEIWADNVSLQSFTKEQWRSHQDKSIDKVRKQRVRFHITYANKTAMEGGVISIKQIKSGFPFGCGMNHYILTNTDYQDWFASRFKFTTFTNEMKWYSTEKIEGVENYTIPDAMVKFCEKNGISIRGHNIFWDNPKHQPEWVKTLSPEDLKEAAARRINSVTTRYAGKLIHWDVMNENLHFRFYEDNLGNNASAEYYRTAHLLDPQAIMFLNEYNTIEFNNDETVNAHNYSIKLEEIISYPGNGNMCVGIGLQGHFNSGKPNLPYMRSALDLLGSFGFPIWLTEVDVDKGSPSQAEYFEEILREAYSHPAVKGIISFAGPEAAGFKVMPLTDKDFKNTAAGDVVDKLLGEWKSGDDLVVETSAAGNNGFSEISLFHGDYNLTIKHPVTNSSTSISFKVTKDLPRGTVYVQIDA